MMDALEEVRSRRLMLNRLDAWLFEEISPYFGQRILEIGSGHGNFVQHLLDRELVVATDIEPSSVEIVRRKFAQHPNLQPLVYNACEPVTNELCAFHLDTIVSLNVFEHIEDDLKALSNMAEILWAGGRIILVVPAHEVLYGTMDSSIGHFRRYTKRAMTQKMRQAGFVVEKQFYLNLLGAFGWFVNGRLLKQVVPPSGQLKIFNSVVPLLKWTEQHIRPSAGLSLVSIARYQGRQSFVK
jgi:SAM-dependent methyltransferase